MNFNKLFESGLFLLGSLGFGYLSYSLLTHHIVLQDALTGGGRKAAFFKSAAAWLISVFGPERAQTITGITLGALALLFVLMVFLTLRSNDEEEQEA